MTIVASKRGQMHARASIGTPRGLNVPVFEDGVPCCVKTSPESALGSGLNRSCVGSRRLRRRLNYWIRIPWSRLGVGDVKMNRLTKG
jgi:hypothetical protein